MVNHSVHENISIKVNNTKETEKHIKWKSMKHTETTVPYMLKMFSPSWTV